MAKKTVAKRSTTKRQKVEPPALPDIAPLTPATEKRGRAKDMIAEAGKILGFVTKDYNWQAGHRGNRTLIQTEVWSALKNRIDSLRATYEGKALFKSKREQSFDWDAFIAEVETFRDDMLNAVADNQIAVVNRMVKTGSHKFTPEELRELWDEAQDAPDLRGQIKGWSNLINRLLAIGCWDPKEREIVDGRQTGNRWHGRK